MIKTYIVIFMFRFQKQRRLGALKEACKNKTGTSPLFQAIVQSTDESVRNKTCARAGTFNDYRSAAIALLNATSPNPSDVSAFVDSLPETRVNVTG
jgi:hypothetical protein